jgi:hypothetical protein
VLVELCEECSLLELLSGELSFEFEDDDEWSVVVVDGAIGATTTGTGATTTGAAYTTAGAGATVELSVVVELEVSVESANATGTPANNIAMPKDKAAVFNEYFMMMSPLLLSDDGVNSTVGLPCT